MKSLRLALLLVILLLSQIACNIAAKMPTKEPEVVQTDRNLQVIGKYSIGDNTLFICTFANDTIFILDKVNQTSPASMSVIR